MAWAVYSSEDYPKRNEADQVWEDYKQALGVQVILKAGQWTELEDIYRHVRYESWVDAAGEGRESVTTGRQVAERMAGDFALRGIVCANLDKISDADREKLEKRSKEQNMKFRKLFINRFEEQFRVKTNGGPGRFAPNDYELECYAMHGMTPPEVVQRIQQPQAATAPVIIEQKVDPEMLAQLVAQEMARQAEAKKPTRTI
jgi:hypothetical protein